VYFFSSIVLVVRSVRLRQKSKQLISSPNKILNHKLNGDYVTDAPLKIRQLDRFLYQLTSTFEAKKSTFKSTLGTPEIDFFRQAYLEPNTVYRVRAIIVEKEGSSVEDGARVVFPHEKVHSTW